MKKILLLIIILLLLFKVEAQENLPMIAMNSNEFINVAKKEKINDVYINSNNKVVVIKSNGKKEKFDKNDVWGFRNKKGVSYRLYRGKDYKILKIEGLVIYEAPTTAIVGELIYNDKQYHFSNGLDNPVYELNNENLNEVFTTVNPKFLQLVKENFKNKDLWKRNDADFEIVQLYTESLK